MHMLYKNVSGIIFSNEVSEVLQGEANHSPCCLPGDINCKITSMTFWNSLGFHPHDFPFLPLNIYRALKRFSLL